MLTNKHKAQLIILTTFILGVVVGASGHFLLSKQTSTRQPGTPKEVIEEMTRVLKLDSKQVTQVDRILYETRQKYQEVRNQTKPQYDTIREASRQRIKEMLSPDQEELYRQWNKEQDAKREQKAREEAAKSAK